MKSNDDTPPKRAFLAGLVALLAAVGATAEWLWQTHGATLPVLALVGLLTLTVALGGVWLYRVRAARRHLAALDAYAKQQLARAKHRPPTPSKHVDALR